jgi:hypothetical protein
MTQEEGSKVVGEMAEQREAAAKPPELSILDAIDDAQWLRRTPDGVVGPERLRGIVDTLLSALERSRCYYNAVRRGQETFVLVQQDRAAPAAIGQWAAIAATHGCPDEKVQSALSTAERWRQQVPTSTKWPN